MSFNETEIRELQLTSLKPITQRGWRSRLLIIVLSIFVVAGIAAYVYQLIRGLNVTGLNDDVFFGIYMTNLVAIIGISYGGAIVSAILRITHASWRAPITRLAEALAVVSLIVGALFAIIHLGHAERLWLIFTTPNPASPVLWDIIAITTYLIATLIFFYLPLIPDLAIIRSRFPSVIGKWRTRLYSMLSLKWKGSPKQQSILRSSTNLMALLIIPLAVSVHSVLAWAFSVSGREGWHSSIFGPYFVVAALFSGVAAVIIVVAVFRKAYGLDKVIGPKQIRYLGYLMLVLGLTYIYFTFAEYLTEGYVQTEASVVLIDSMLLGRFAPLFWFFMVSTGIVPVLLIAFPKTRTIRWITFAAVLVVIGMWLKRLLIVVPPLQHGFFGSETAAYTGSWVEFTITLGAIAAIPLMLLVIFRIFPVLSVSEIEEVAAEETERQAKAVPQIGEEVKA
ncbi:NrfD/PsrC family molybdoenzyme membrane anchor subunit [Chloroflexota bacterium]